MTEKKEKTFCYRHPNKETRIKCTECGKPICASCMIQAPVGQKCPDCVASRTTHLERITGKEYFIAGTVGLLTSFILSYLWYLIAPGWFLIGLFLAYGVGFVVCRAIQKAIGMKIGYKIQAISGTSVFAGMFYNPVQILIDFLNSNFQVSLLLGDLEAPLFMFTQIASGNFSAIWTLLSIVIAIWASVYHFKI